MRIVRITIFLCALVVAAFGSLPGEGRCGDPLEVNAYHACLRNTAIDRPVVQAMTLLEDEGFSRTARSDGILSMLKRYDGIHNRTMAIRLRTDDRGRVDQLAFDHE